MNITGDSLQWYLEEHPVIDFTHPQIRELIGSLRGAAETDEHYARAAYEFVRVMASVMRRPICWLRYCVVRAFPRGY